MPEYNLTPTARNILYSGKAKYILQSESFNLLSEVPVPFDLEDAEAIVGDSRIEGISHSTRNLINSLIDANLLEVTDPSGSTYPNYSKRKKEQKKNKEEEQKRKQEDLLRMRQDQEISIQEIID